MGKGSITLKRLRTTDQERYGVCTRKTFFYYVDTVCHITNTDLENGKKKKKKRAEKGLITLQKGGKDS